jgi:ABC-type microcin C transport system permease subunit YejE
MPDLRPISLMPDPLQPRFWWNALAGLLLLLAWLGLVGIVRLMEWIRLP